MSTAWARNWSHRVPWVDRAAPNSMSYLPGSPPRFFPRPPCVQLFFTHLRIISLLSTYGMVMFCAWDAHEGILLLYKTPIIRIFFGD